MAMRRKRTIFADLASGNRIFCRWFALLIIGVAMLVLPGPAVLLYRLAWPFWRPNFDGPENGSQHARQWLRGRFQKITSKQGMSRIMNTVKTKRKTSAEAIMSDRGQGQTLGNQLAG